MNAAVDAHTGTSGDVLAAVRDVVGRIDDGSQDTGEILRRLGTWDLLAQPVPASAALIADIAEECMSSAFSLWAHRMVIDYFARGERTDRNIAIAEQLRRGELFGSTAMASGMKALAGIEPLGVEGRFDGDQLVVSGSLRWASNLMPGAVVVIPVQLDAPAGPDRTDRLIAWFQVGDRGVDVSYVDGLLALNGTASGSVTLTDVRIDPDAVLSWDFTTTARAFRPTFLLLQSSFCVGISRKSVRESQALASRPGNDGLIIRLSETETELDRLSAEWRRLTDLVDTGDLVDFVRFRLEASLLAGEATRLESAMAGGRGYVTTSDTARRFREAAFLPVQSPSEGQLRWELSSLAS